MYEYEHKDLRFTKGGFDELIALDRYAVNSTDPKDLAVGDTVVFIDDPAKGSRRVGTIEATYAQYSDGTPLPSNTIIIKDRDGEHHVVPIEHIVKPLETTPAEFWSRWAHGAALVEAAPHLTHYGTWLSKLEDWQDEFRWLFDGYRYSPGGRIQLGLGHEYLGREKANLTLGNCFGLPRVERGDYELPDTVDPVDQWHKVLASLRNQIELQRRGGGTGTNISDIATIAGASSVRISAILDNDHHDYHEIDALRRHGKLDGFDSLYNINPRHNEATMIVVHDSIEGIIIAVQRMVVSAYSGERVLVDFSNLRCRHAPVANIGRSSGAASWMTLFALVARLLRQETIDAVDFAELFATTTNLVEQGGGRRGACMLVLNVDSPVIEKFVTRKRTAGHLVGANVSVGVTDAFMAKVKRFQDYPGVSAGGSCFSGWSVEKEHDYRSCEKEHRIWSLIVESAHASGEPGVIFLDRVNRESNSWYYDKIDVCNPCGEVPLPPNGMCCLGHLVLPRFVKGDWTRENIQDTRETLTDAYVDWGELERAVRLAVRFQDDMIDYSLYPTEATKAQQMKERRVGIGTMGLGTMLIMLGLRYGSDEALDFIDSFYSSIAYWAYDESINLAAEKEPFPAYDIASFAKSGFMKRLLEEFPQLKRRLVDHGIRNVTLLTQAPTGTTGSYISVVLGKNGVTPGTSTGIEPYYAFGYERSSRIGTFWVTEDIVAQYLGANGHTAKLNDDGSTGEFDQGDLPDYFVTAMGLTPEEHVQTQATIQRWVDASISKTVNMPDDATLDDAMRTYMLAYDSGCKGVTIFVDGSRAAQVLSTERGGSKLEAQAEAESMEAIVEARKDTPFEEWVQADDFIPTGEVSPRAYIEASQPAFVKRPTRVFGFTERLNVLVGETQAKAYVTINVHPDTSSPFEVIASANDPAIADIAMALGRTVTQMLRYGGTDDNVAQTIKHLKRGQSNMYSLPSQLARLIEEVAYRGVEFPVDDPFNDEIDIADIDTWTSRSVVEYTPGDEDHLVPKALESTVLDLIRKPRNLSTCPECGEKAYDKVACTCTMCGASRCS